MRTRTMPGKRRLHNCVECWCRAVSPTHCLWVLIDPRALSGWLVAEPFSALSTNTQASLTKPPHHFGQERSCLAPKSGITSCLSNLQQATERWTSVHFAKGRNLAAWSAADASSRVSRESSVSLVTNHLPTDHRSDRALTRHLP